MRSGVSGTCVLRERRGSGKRVKGGASCAHQSARPVSRQIHDLERELGGRSVCPRWSRNPVVGRGRGPAYKYTRGTDTG